MKGKRRNGVNMNMKVKKRFVEEHIDCEFDLIKVENTIMLYKGVPLTKFSKKYLIKILTIIGNY